MCLLSSDDWVNISEGGGTTMLELSERYEVLLDSPCFEMCENELCNLEYVSTINVIPLKGNYVKELVDEFKSSNKISRRYRVLLSEDFKGVVYQVNRCKCKKWQRVTREIVFCNVEEEFVV